jgi:hypothetical protein
MDVDDLLRRHAGLERALERTGGATAPELRRRAGSDRAESVAEPSSGRTPLCLPAWRLLREATLAEPSLHAWWQDHGRGCAACALRLRRVREENPRLSPFLEEVTEQEVPIATATVSSPRASWAAATPDTPDDPSRPLPLVLHRRLGGAVVPALRSVWLVAWDERLLLLLGGAEDALDAWRGGASVLDREGVLRGRFVPADPATAEILCPGRRGPDGPALCLECQEPAASLPGDGFRVPEILEGTVRLVPGLPPGGPLEAVRDLAARNRIRPFLESLPDDVGDPAVRETLIFYLRWLLRQGRLPGPWRARLRELPWLSGDLAAALG